MFIRFLSVILLFQSIIFSMNDVCNSCENTWLDPYWGEQCCDAAWDQWGFDCAYMEDEYGWDCTGCSCPYDTEAICGDGFCTGDETINNCSSDCTINGCNVENQVDDCYDGDCCPISWIGDGYGDCEEPDNFGCDLSCYANDGGDCPAQEGDINDDGWVDVLDIIIAVEFILNYDYDILIDLNSDGIINISDIILFINIILII